MIRNLVPELIAENPAFRDEHGRINLSEVQRQTGLNYRTVRDWAANRIKGVDFKVYEVWCNFFGVDVLRYEKEG